MALAYGRVDDIANPGKLDVEVNRSRSVEEWLTRARDAYVRGDCDMDELERSVEQVLESGQPVS